MKEEGSKISSMVDNTFYVLKRCSMRALSTNNIISACSIVNMLANILNIDFRQELEKRLVVAFGAGSTSETLNPYVRFFDELHY